MRDLIERLLLIINQRSISLVNNRLPFRPIIYGGDDVTFISEGSLGLTLAKYYLDFLSRYPLSDGQPIHARAGVAITKTHFPFSQAYHLSEALNQSARAYAKELQQERRSPAPPYTIDWHVSSSGPVMNLETIRKRLYQRTVGQATTNLLMRPLEIDMTQDRNNNWRTWANFERLLTDFKYGTPWSESQSKLKMLEQELPRGQEAVNHFLKRYRLPELPTLEILPTASTAGWVAGTAVYYDALDTLEFFTPV